MSGALFPMEPAPVRAVTLIQPWASLVFRCKAHETRSTPFLRGAEGETIVLAASARFPATVERAKSELDAWRDQDKVRTAFKRRGLRAAR